MVDQDLDPISVHSANVSQSVAIEVTGRVVRGTAETQVNDSRCALRSTPYRNCGIARPSQGIGNAVAIDIQNDYTLRFARQFTDLLDTEREGCRGRR